MAEITEIAVVLPVEASSCASAVASCLEPHLDALLKSLDSPSASSVKVAVAAAGGKSVRLDVSIGGVPCRRNRERPLGPPLVVAEIVADVLRIVYDNRLLLSPLPLIADIVRERVPRLIEADGIRAVERGIELGLPLSRAIAVLDYCDKRPCDDWIEDGLAAVLDSGIRVRTAPDVLAMFNESGAEVTPDATFAATMRLARSGLFHELGVLLGDIHLVADASIPAPAFVLEVNGVDRGLFAGVPQGGAFVNDTAERVTQLLRLEAQPARNPANFSFGAMVSGDARAVCEDAGLTTWTPISYLVLTIAGHVRRNAGALLTINSVEYRLSVLWESQPRLVEATLALFSSARICRVLRLLAMEGVSVRDLGTVLEVLIELESDKSHRANDWDYVAEARQRLAGAICEATSRDGMMSCVVLSHDVEARLAMSDEFSIEERHQIVESVDAIVAGGVPTALPKVLLVSAAARARLREWLAIELPSLRVLGYNELTPSVIVQPVGEVRLS